jgi:hypothetical protein
MIDAASVRAHASVRRSSIAAGDASRGSKSLCESAVAIRAKNRFWRAAMRRKAGGHENFLIAKIRDSESVQRAFQCCSRVAATRAAHRSIDA